MQEIERKFLVNPKMFSYFKQARVKSTGEPPFAFFISQLYLANSRIHDIRIRVESHEDWVRDKCLMTVKSKSLMGTRTEVNIPMTEEQATALMALHPADRVITKTRYVIEGQFDQAPTEDNPRCFTIDEFHGGNEGLILAEIELYQQDTPIDMWVGMFDTEVTDDERYYNSHLHKHPYSTWPSDV